MPMSLQPVVSVAPMVDVTGRHFRYLIRLMSKRTTLWTPMFTASRLARRKRRVVDSMLRFHPRELPLVAQIGGDDVRTMLSAARKCEAAGYSEVNINLGCPARNAQSGNYGAMLMHPPHDQLLQLAGDLVSALNIPVSVKLRIGVDEHDNYDFMRDFVKALHVDAGVDRFVVHAMRLCLVPTPADPSSAGSAHSKKPTAPTCRPEHSTGSRRSLETERSSVWTLMSVRTTMVAVTCSPPAQTRSGASSVESAQQSIRVRYLMGTTHSLFLTMATDSQAASMWTNVVCRLLTRPMAVATR